MAGDHNHCWQAKVITRSVAEQQRHQHGPGGVDLREGRNVALCCRAPQYLGSLFLKAASLSPLSLVWPLCLVKNDSTSSLHLGEISQGAAKAAQYAGFVSCSGTS